MRSIKVRAAETDRTLTDVMTELLRTGLNAGGDEWSTPHRVEFPLVLTARTAPEGSLSPERIAGILADADVDDLTS